MGLDKYVENNNLPEAKCKHCGRKRKYHKAYTFHCPLSKHQYSDFHRENVFEWDGKAVPQPKFLI